MYHIEKIVLYNIVIFKFLLLVYSKNLFIFAALKHGYYAKHGT